MRAVENRGSHSAPKWEKHLIWDPATQKPPYLSYKSSQRMKDETPLMFFTFSMHFYVLQVLFLFFGGGGQNVILAP